MTKQNFETHATMVEFVQKKYYFLTILQTISEGQQMYIIDRWTGSKLHLNLPTA